MAIERKQMGSMEDSYDPEEPMPEEGEAETIDIPTSMLGGNTVAPGDVVRLEVVSVNDDSGTVSVKYATAPKEGGSINRAAAKFEA